jgi:hypothetical protein
VKKSGVLALSLVTIVACGSFAGTNTGPSDGDAGPTTGADGGGTGGDALGAQNEAGPVYVPCTPQTGTMSFFTASFDGATPTYTFLGGPLDAPTPMGQVNVSWTGSPNSSPPGSMEIETKGDPYYIAGGPQDAPINICVLTAHFDFWPEQFASIVNNATLAVLGIRKNSFDHCYVALQLEPKPVPHMILQSHCGIPDSNQYKDVTTNALPAISTVDPVHVTFVVNFGQRYAKVQGFSDTQMDLGTDQITVGGPTGYVEFGFDGKGDDAHVRFDSIDVEMQ